MKYLEFRVDIENIFPAIYRQFEIPESSTFYDLHLAIQACGWENYHLWEFLDNKKKQLAGIPDDESAPDGPDADVVLIKEYFQRKGKICHYLYDFGDGWEHKVQLVGRSNHDCGSKMILVAGARSFPPEDCGGYGGYERAVEFSKTGCDPWGEEDNLKAWLGDWHPDNFDLEQLRGALPILEHQSSAEELEEPSSFAEKFLETNDDMEVFLEALSLLDVEDFRDLCNELILQPALDVAGTSILRDEIVFRARKKCPQWELPAVDDTEVRWAMAFLNRMREGLQFEPEEIDEVLRFSSAALLRDNYGLSVLILKGLLPALMDAKCEVLGSFDCVSEVLTYDLSKATTELAVGAFGSIPLDRRPELLYAIFDDSPYLSLGFQPLRSMMAASVLPFPQWEEFLPLWVAYLEEKQRESNSFSQFEVIPHWIKEAKSLISKFPPQVR